MKTINIDGINYELTPMDDESIVAPEMVDIPGGHFMMGSPKHEESRYSDEGPRKRVDVKAFRMQKYETTFEEFDRFCEATDRKKPPDTSGRGKRPVVNVSWDDAVAYAEWLSEQTGRKFRLPTEEEWEYACRAGSDTAYCFGDDVKDLKLYAVYDADKTSPVGTKKPNAWGLYDMHGNVWEWTLSEKKS